MARFDVLVIGGGPAGASAALLLARAGRAVAVVEKTAFPRRKVCGEYIAPPAASFLRSLGIALETEVRKISIWTGERCLSAPLPKPHASTCAREDLDSFLLNCAARAGAAVFQPHKIASLTRCGAGFTCETQLMAIEANIVVAAHGSWEPGELPTQHRHPAPSPSDLLAFKAHFQEAEFAADGIALVPFAGGYGGVLRLGDGRATFACCIRRDALEGIREPGVQAGESVWRHALRASAALREAFAGARRDGAWLASGPLRPGARPLYRDGIFAVGNAAGEVHPLIGSGISMALRSAAFLADALEGNTAPADAARAYEARWRGEFGRRLWWSTRFAGLASRPAPAAGLVARAPWLLTLAARVSA
jgi:flavin-dependent dehydrogenase